MWSYSICAQYVYTDTCKHPGNIQTEPDSNHEKYVYAEKGTSMHTPSGKCKWRETQAEEIGGASFKATRGYHTKKLFLKSLLIDTSSDKELMRVYVRVFMESNRQNGLEPKEEDLSLRQIDIMTTNVKSGKHITIVCGIEVNSENLTCK